MHVPLCCRERQDGVLHAETMSDFHRNNFQTSIEMKTLLIAVYEKGSVSEEF